MVKFFKDLFGFFLAVRFAVTHHTRLAIDPDWWLTWNVWYWEAEMQEAVTNTCQFFWVAVYKYPLLRLFHSPFWSAYLGIGIPVCLVGIALMILFGINPLTSAITILSAAAVGTLAGVILTKLASTKPRVANDKPLKAQWQEGNLLAKSYIVLLCTEAGIIFAIVAIPWMIFQFVKRHYCPLLPTAPTDAETQS